MMNDKMSQQIIAMKIPALLYLLFQMFIMKSETIIGTYLIFHADTINF